jgi:serine/threonine protein kinase
MVLEYAPKGTLLNLINLNKLTVPTLKSLFKKITQALKYLHCKGYAHRDLKL